MELWSVWIGLLAIGPTVPKFFFLYVKITRGMGDQEAEGGKETLRGILSRNFLLLDPLDYARRNKLLFFGLSSKKSKKEGGRKDGT